MQKNEITFSTGGVTSDGLSINKQTGIVINNLGEPSKKKMSQKVEKVHNFLDPPPPLGWFGLFWIWKKLEFEDPPSDLLWGKIEIGKILNIQNPPQNKKYKLKTLKIV